MAGPAKKRAAAEKKDEKMDHADESSNDSTSNESFGEIQADFEGRNPEPEDFHGIKQLLHQLFLKAHIDLSQVSDLLIAQSGVGSVLKQSCDDEDENDDDMDDNSGTLDVFGITSVLNLASHKEKQCVKQITSLISELAKEHATLETQTEIEVILKENKLGLLLNERFLNIPFKISDPLLTCLEKEIDRIKIKDATYNFDYYVMICKMHKMEVTEESDEECILFANAEEEIFAKEAKVHFEFNVTKESDTSVSGKWKEGDKQMLPFRKVIFFKGNQLNNIIKKVCTFVNQPNIVTGK